MPLGGRRTGGRPEIKPVHLSLPDLAHQRSFTAGRTLAFIPASRRFSAGSIPSA
jgi:hypothetical protein